MILFIASGPVSVTKGVLFDALSIFMFIAMTLTVVRLYKGVRDSDGLKKIQIKYLFISGLIFMSFVFSFDFLLSKKS
jgi:hypothetical protein